MLWDFSRTDAELLRRFTKWNLHAENPEYGKSYSAFNLVKRPFSDYGSSGLKPQFHNMHSLARLNDSRARQQDPEAFDAQMKTIARAFSRDPVARVRFLLEEEQAAKRAQLSTFATEEERQDLERSLAAQRERVTNILAANEQLRTSPKMPILLKAALETETPSDWFQDPPVKNMPRELPNPSQPPENQEFTYASWTGELFRRIYRPGPIVAFFNPSPQEEEGYTAISTPEYNPRLDLSLFNALQIKVRSSGPRFAFLVQPLSRLYLEVFKSFIRLPPNEWFVIEIPFSEMFAMQQNRFRIHPRSLDRRQIVSFGFSSLGELGPFQIDIEWIKAVRTSDEAVLHYQDV